MARVQHVKPDSNRGGAADQAGRDGSLHDDAEVYIGEIRVDPEFAALIPPLSQTELDLLEESLKREGLREDLLVWKEMNILLDGHNRRRLCQKNGIEPRVKYLSFPDREAARAFVVRTQLARRNLSREAESYLRGKRYLDSRHQGARSTSGQSDPKSQEGARSTSGQSDPKRMSEGLAQEFKVSEKTIRRDASFALAVDGIVKNCGDKAKQHVLSRGSRLHRNQVIRLAKMKPKEQQEFFDQLTKTGKPPKAKRKRTATMVLPTEPKALVDTLRRKFSRRNLEQIMRLLSRLERKAKTSK